MLLEGFSPSPQQLAPVALREPAVPAWQHRTGHSSGQAGMAGSVPYPRVTNREMSACLWSPEVAEASCVPGLPPATPHLRQGAEEPGSLRFLPHPGARRRTACPGGSRTNQMHSPACTHPLSAPQTCSFVLGIIIYPSKAQRERAASPWAPLALPQHGRWGPLGLQICLFDHKRTGTLQPRREDGKGKAALFIAEHQDLSLNSGLISPRPD